jgi:hypothetical protein
MTVTFPEEDIVVYRGSSSKRYGMAERPPSEMIIDAEEPRDIFLDRNTDPVVVTDPEGRLLESGSVFVLTAVM